MIGYLIAFLFGALTGAAATYLGNRLTDQHRKKEAVSDGHREFESVRTKMPDLISEIRSDLETDGNELLREFFLSKRAHILNPGNPCFVYYEDDHPDLQSKVHILENVAYVVDVTPGNAPKYLMTEEFVDHILKGK